MIWLLSYYLIDVWLKVIAYFYSVWKNFQELFHEILFGAHISSACLSLVSAAGHGRMFPHHAGSIWQLQALGEHEESKPIPCHSGSRDHHLGRHTSASAAHRSSSSHVRGQGWASSLLLQACCSWTRLPGTPQAVTAPWPVTAHILKSAPDVQQREVRSQEGKVSCEGHPAPLAPVPNTVLTPASAFYLPPVLWVLLLGLGPVPIHSSCSPTTFVSFPSAFHCPSFTTSPLLLWVLWPQTRLAEAEFIRRFSQSITNISYYSYLIQHTHRFMFICHIILTYAK